MSGLVFALVVWAVATTAFIGGCAWHGVHHHDDAFDDSGWHE